MNNFVIKTKLIQGIEPTPPSIPSDIIQRMTQRYVTYNNNYCNKTKKLKKLKNLMLCQQHLGQYAK